MTHIISFPTRRDTRQTLAARGDRLEVEAEPVLHMEDPGALRDALQAEVDAYLEAMERDARRWVGQGRARAMAVSREQGLGLVLRTLRARRALLQARSPGICAAPEKGTLGGLIDP